MDAVRRFLTAWALTWTAVTALGACALLFPAWWQPALDQGVLGWLWALAMLLAPPLVCAGQWSWIRDGGPAPGAARPWPAAPRPGSQAPADGFPDGSRDGSPDGSRDASSAATSSSAGPPA